MPAATIGPSNLLEYNQQYKLLVCRQCRYAVQKNALQSHLLRHKIYRGERQQLLALISKLDLLEPQHVPLPSPGSVPIETLPILFGFRCLASGCYHLTVSSKRMRRHWSQVHELGSNSAGFVPKYRRARVQTFFRGTKVRYFEVETTADDIFHDKDDDDLTDIGETMVGSAQTPENLEIATTTPSPHSLSISNTVTNSSVPTSLDLQALKYFHHFLTKSSPTLPIPQAKNLCTAYWCTLAVGQALQHEALMFGILAISAFHIASLANDTTNMRYHYEQATQFAFRFSNESERGNTLVPNSTVTEMQKHIPEEYLVENVEIVLNFAQWASIGPQHNASSANASRLSSIISFIRDNVVPYTRCASDIDIACEHELQDDVHSVFTKNSSLKNPQSDRLRSNSPSIVISQLHALPFQIAERLGRTEASETVYATLLSIKIMVECCKTSYENNKTDVIWKAMASWLVDLPDYFNKMLQQKHPAALVVVAYWAVILVKRAEANGCWFLTGSADAILTYIKSELALEGPTVLDLVACLENAADT